MALIANRRKGRRDGGYTRILGDADVGSLLSMLHATSIASGNELEKRIAELCPNLMSADSFALFCQGKLLSGFFVLTRPLIRQLKSLINSNHEPDFVLVDFIRLRCYVIEMKDGDTFDTKKSIGEISSLKEFSDSLRGLLCSMGIDLPVSIKFCSFNQTSPSAIVAGVKSAITIDEALTGKDFCALVGINYASLLSARKCDSHANLSYFLDELLKIPSVRSYIAGKLPL